METECLHTGIPLDNVCEHRLNLSLSERIYKKIKKNKNGPSAKDYAKEQQDGKKCSITIAFVIVLSSVALGTIKRGELFFMYSSAIS